MFQDRKDAGEQLGRALEKFRDKGVLILAVPRGGVEVAAQAARHLNTDFSLLMARKLPYPSNPEAGFGAVAEDGSLFVYPHVKRELSRETIERIIEEQKREIARRIEVLRHGKPLPEIAGRTVILIDDGLAMGSTIRAAIQLCMNRMAGKIIVAVPVAGRRTAQEISEAVDELIVLEKPLHFQAVAQVYQNWHDATDEEVLQIIQDKENTSLSDAQ